MSVSDVTLQAPFEMRFLTDALHILLAGWATALGVPLPLHPRSEITGALRVPDIFKFSHGGPNSSPHACLQTDLSPAPSIIS